MNDYVLLTGATGFVGRYLIRDLLVDGRNLAVLVRPNKKQTCRERIESICQFWEDALDRVLPRPVILEGNVCEPGLGLRPRERRWAAEHCRSIIHNAAVLTFIGADRNRDPWATNLSGVNNVLEFCEKLNIEHMYHVSTAYVCGERTDRVYEDQLDVGQTFRNDYEESKFRAEKRVEAADFFKSVTILRPGVICGDSQTGYTHTYHGVSAYLRLLSMLVPEAPLNAEGKRHTKIRLPMTGEEPRNFVPVDWVSEVITHIVNTPEARGHTFHLTPCKPLTPKRLIDFCCDYFNSTGVEYVGENLPDPSEWSDFEKRFFETLAIYQSYDRTDPEFDNTNIRKFAPHLPCPELSEDVLRRYMTYGENDRWGKSKDRSQTPEVPLWIEDCIGAIAKKADRFFWLNLIDEKTAPLVLNGDVKWIGVEVAGPGGGQWTLHFDSNECVGFDRGLKPNLKRIASFNTEEFHQNVASAFQHVSSKRS